MCAERQSSRHPQSLGVSPIASSCFLINPERVFALADIPTTLPQWAGAKGIIDRWLAIQRSSGVGSGNSRTRTELDLTVRFCESAIDVAHGFDPRHIGIMNFRNAEARARNQGVDFLVQAASLGSNGFLEPLRACGGRGFLESSGLNYSDNRRL